MVVSDGLATSEADKVLVTVKPTPIPVDDIDGDGIADNVDNCLSVDNPDQADADLDGLGNDCDLDDDNDGIVDEDDNCPFVSNEDQEDGDGDDVGTACDPDESVREIHVPGTPVDSGCASVAPRGHIPWSLALLLLGLFFITT